MVSWGMAKKKPTKKKQDPAKKTIKSRVAATKKARAQREALGLTVQKKDENDLILDAHAASIREDRERFEESRKKRKVAAAKRYFGVNKATKKKATKKK